MMKKKQKKQKEDKAQNLKKKNKQVGSTMESLKLFNIGRLLVVLVCSLAVYK